jgi:hypothetical protein
MKALLKALTPLIIFLCVADSHAQMGAVEIDILRQRFKNFEYDSVVTLADRILRERQDLSQQDQIDLLQMKAISHYSILEMNAALSCFLEILKLNPQYSLDPIRTSPKILSFFNEVKSSFLRERYLPAAPERMAIPDTIRAVGDNGTVLRRAITRSLVLPGWGHFYLKQKKKALFLTTASLVSLCGGIYFSSNCRDKERAYLNETDKLLMNDRYEKYNRSFKVRNSLIASYAAIWLYSQADLLVFQKKIFSEKFSFFILPYGDQCRQTTLFCLIEF